MTASLETVDFVVLVVYVLAVVAFGCWFVRKSGTTGEFMAAGGSLPGWAVGMSIFGTYLSSNTFLGNPGKAYADDFNGYVFTLSLPVAAWIAATFFVPFYRRSGEISAYHHFERRFGRWARTYAVVCYLLTQVARMGTIMFGVALGLHALTGWDVAGIIAVTGVLVTLYTLVGGIEAVIWTDVIQSIVLMAGALLILVLLLVGTPDGPAQAVSLAWESGKMTLGSWEPDFTASTVWVVFLFGLFINLTNFGIDQSFVQRYHTASSEASAKWSVWVGALMYVPISLLFFVIGVLLFSYYTVHPDRLDEVRLQVAEERVEAAGGGPSVEAVASALTPDDIGDRVLPHFISNRLPLGMAGLLIAAIFAAAMSSIDTSLNSSATIILKDIYQRYIDPAVTERGSMAVLRVTTVAMGLIGTGIALTLIGVKGLLDAWWLLQGVFAGGLLGLFLLGILSKRTTGTAAGVAVAVGVVAILWLTASPELEVLPPQLRNPLHANMTIVVGVLLIFAVGFFISHLTPGSRRGGQDG